MSLTETAPLTETTSLTETTPLEETTPVTPTDDLPPTEEVVEPAPLGTEPTLPTFDSPPPTPLLLALGPGLLLTVQGGEEAIQPGDAVVLMITVANTGDEPAREVIVEAVLPESLHLTDRQAGWEYSRQIGRLSAQLGDLEPGAQVTLSLELTTWESLDALAEVVFEARIGATIAAVEVSQDSATATIAATTTILVAHPKTVTVERGGGRVVSEDGRVWVDFPPGALDQTREITVWAAHRDMVAEDKQTGTLMRFSLEPDMQFSAPVTVIVDMSGLINAGALSPAERIVMQTWNAETRQWEPVSGQFDAEHGLLTATVAHFSTYSVDLSNTPAMMISSDPGSTPAMWKFLYNPPVVSAFSGAAAHNYPIDVPAGRGGLQPTVNLSYSSRRVDGLLGYLSIDAGPLGLGWSADQIDIVRNRWGARVGRVISVSATISSHY